MKYLMLVLCMLVGCIGGAVLIPWIAGSPALIEMDGNLVRPCGLYVFAEMGRGGMLGLAVGTVVGVGLAYAAHRQERNSSAKS
jgi:hypothetical protein